jgi:hypothetical protein
MTISRRGSRRRVIKVAPYRKSKKVPKRRKSCFWEYGNDYDETTGRWTLFVDIISGNADLVDFVGFRFASTGETHNVYSRFPTTLSDGTVAHRFSFRGEFPAFRKITILLIGRSGKPAQVYSFLAKMEDCRSKSLQFYEARELRPHYITAPSIDFGVEFEMSCSRGTDQNDIAKYIKNHADVCVKDSMDDYRGGKEQYNGWKLVPDSSVVCSISSPNCSRFELVSPILNGEDGLDQCNRVLKAARESGTISLNTSMAFHVHVNVENLSLEQLKNVCLNYIKYEEEIDTFMPPSRRDSRNKFCISNRDAIKQHGNGRKHSAIINCRSRFELYDLINPSKFNPKGPRYYKLNLQNLKHNRINTIEFRQHSCTSNFNKVEAWVRFCTRFVHNSTYRPQSLKPCDDPFELLFDTVIQDIKLKDYYRRRKNDVFDEDENDYDERVCREKLFGGNSGHNHGQCCGGCEDGHACERSPVERLTRLLTQYAGRQNTQVI